MTRLFVPPLSDREETLRTILPVILEDACADAVLLLLIDRCAGGLQVIHYRQGDTAPKRVVTPSTLAVEEILEMGSSPGPWRSERARNLQEVLNGIAMQPGYVVPVVPIDGGSVLGQMVLSFATDVVRNDADRWRSLTGVLAQALQNAEQWETMRDQAMSDPLTGLLNKRGLMKRLEEEIDRAKRFGDHLGCVYIDLDDFKGINDTLGHNVGDEIIASVGASIRNEIRGSDVPARFGGDEFVVLLAGTRLFQAQIVAERLILAFPRIEHPGLRRLGRQVTASVGVAVYPNQASTGNILLESADRAMYKAKREGGNKACMYGG